MILEGIKAVVGFIIIVGVVRAIVLYQRADIDWTPAYTLISGIIVLLPIPFTAIWMSPIDALWVIIFFYIPGLLYVKWAYPKN